MAQEKTGTPKGDVATKERANVQEPRRHKVLLHNDDYTTQQFVVEVLVRFFKRTPTDAIQIMLTVHHAGLGVAGTYSAEVAEAKVAQVTEHARASGFPLRCTMEPE